MNTYLVTFGNIFEHVKFMETSKQYFTKQAYKNFELKVHNSKFCEITVYTGCQFCYNQLQKDLPCTKVVLKLRKGSRVNYINL